jgi:hypothetical protein
MTFHLKNSQALETQTTMADSWWKKVYGYQNAHQSGQMQNNTAEGSFFSLF